MLQLKSLKSKIPLSDFHKIWRGRGSRWCLQCTFMPNFTIIALNVGMLIQKSRKLVIFGTNLPTSGESLEAIFTKFGVREQVPDTHPQAKFYHCGFRNVSVLPPKSTQFVIFWYKFAHKKKSWGPYKNLNIGAQLKPSSMQWHHCFENYTD